MTSIAHPRMVNDESQWVVRYIKLLWFYATSVLSFTVCKEFTYNDFFYRQRAYEC